MTDEDRIDPAFNPTTGLGRREPTPEELAEARAKGWDGIMWVYDYADGRQSPISSLQIDR